MDHGLLARAQGLENLAHRRFLILLQAYSYCSGRHNANRTLSRLVGRAQKQDMGDNARKKRRSRSAHCNEERRRVVPLNFRCGDDTAVTNTAAKFRRFVTENE